MRVGGDKNVIDINIHVWDSLKDLIHETLEILSRVFQPKGGARKDE